MIKRTTCSLFSLFFHGGFIDQKIHPWISSPVEVPRNGALDLKKPHKTWRCPRRDIYPACTVRLEDLHIKIAAKSTNDNGNFSIANNNQRDIGCPGRAMAMYDMEDITECHMGALGIWH